MNMTRIAVARLATGLALAVGAAVLAGCGGGRYDDTTVGGGPGGGSGGGSSGNTLPD